MPAIALTRVDLPAPLSPTRPTTSPALTVKSTRSNAWTGPNRLLMPSSSRSGVPPAAISTRDSRFFAIGRVGAGAEFGGGDEPVFDHRALDVVLHHRDRFQNRRRNFGLAVVDFFGDFLLRQFFAFGEGYREFGGDFSLRRDRLVDRHVLLAGEDPLQAGDGRVLTGDGAFFRVDPSPFQRRDRAAAGVVVGGVDAPEAVVAERGDRLLRLALGVFRGPTRGVVFLGDFDPGGFEAFGRARLEERCVRIGRIAVDLDHRTAGVPVFFQFFRQRFSLQFADPFVVEGDVGGDFAVFDQAVVADDRHALGVGAFGDRSRRFRVHRVEHEDFGAFGQRCFALSLLFFSVATGVEVDDFTARALFFDRFFEVRL